MYSPGSSVLSSLEHAGSVEHRLLQQQGQCLKFKYFVTFLVSTACLALLSGSLVTHKWIVAKPIRILKFAGSGAPLQLLHWAAQAQPANQQQQQPPLASLPSQLESSPADGKFQGEIYFGLFKGVKVLNFGFGDRINPISEHGQQEELVHFKLWLLTLASVSVAVVFALVGSIFAIINFVMTPGGTLSGPIGLVVWNSIACFSCLTASISWLIEYFARLKENVLSQEEVQNGWTSDRRSQFGYSYYFVLVSFVLHLVNIFIISVVQFDSWTSQKAVKREARSACEGVIMLY